VIIGNFLFCRFATTTVKSSDDQSSSINEAQAEDLLWKSKEKPGSVSEVERQKDYHQSVDMSDPLHHFSWLTDVAPCFSVDGNKMKVLSEPAEFFETLKVIMWLLYLNLL
jgi:hypothetical protein